jgi:RNA polymerase sigma-70 factor (ECF subfamily)
MQEGTDASFFQRHARLIARLYELAQAARWQLPAVKFASALAGSARHRFGAAEPAPSGLAAYLEGLHVDDLALACACSDGCEAAWEHFVTQFRPELYRAGRAIAGDDRGRELADSIFAELYGLQEREGKRRSLFDYFYGRSKLSTWLRAVLTQRHVDGLRAGRRTEPLEAAGEGAGAQEGVQIDPERARYLALLQAALAEALGQLEPRDRLRLCYYYVEDLTLAQIGRLLGEHEATASRNLERTRRGLRKQVERRLRDSKRLSDAQIRLCFEYACEDWPFDLTGALSGRE